MEVRKSRSESESPFSRWFTLGKYYSFIMRIIITCNLKFVLEIKHWKICTIVSSIILSVCDNF